MKKLLYGGRAFYAIAMGAIGIQQICYSNLVNFIGPTWPASFPGYTVLVYIFSVYLVALMVATLCGLPVKRYYLILAGILLALDVLSQVPFLYAVLPYKKTHLGVWVNVLKELALTGGALIAARIPVESPSHKSAPDNNKVSNIVGPLFFSITMGCFGVAHFLYAEPTTTLLPRWMPLPFFWVYFTGSALVAGALLIVLHIKTYTGALLLGSMIFIWIWAIHLHGVITDPLGEQGNQISAALSALAFSGIAFMIAGLSRHEFEKTGTGYTQALN